MLPTALSEDRIRVYVTLESPDTHLIVSLFDSDKEKWEQNQPSRSFTY